MTETIIIALIFAKIKGYKIVPLFKSWAIYPVIFMEAVNWIGQAMIFNGDYAYIKIVPYIKLLYIASYLFLIFKYEIYHSAILGSAFMVLGGIFNDIAIKANGGYMPVFPSLSYLTGYARTESFDIVQDIHILGNSASKLKFFTDYIDLGYSILSIGDIFIRVFAFLIIYSSVRKLNIDCAERKNTNAKIIRN